MVLSRLLRRAVIVVVVVVMTVAAAAEEERRRRPKPMPRTRDVRALGRGAFRHLDRAHQALADGNYSASLAALDKMKRDLDGLTDHERALMWQAYGYTYSSQGRFDEASTAFEKCLTGDGLPEAARQDVRYNLAQLYMALERYDDAIDVLLEWLDESEKPSPRVYYLLAMAYVQNGEDAKAFDHAKRAVALSHAPEEPWLQLLLSMLIERERYREAIPVLEELLARFPRKSHWVQLSAVHSELGDHKKALGALEAAYVQDFLGTDRELRTLAQLYLYNEVPYKAARVLERGLEAGTVASDAEAWELLGNAWLRAKERDRAMEPLERAAKLSPSGDRYMLLAQVYLEQERWVEARASIEAALEKGRLDDPSNAHLLLGIVNVNDERWEEARDAFETAGSYPGAQESASRWLDSIEAELKVDAAETENARPAAVSAAGGNLDVGLE